MVVCLLVVWCCLCKGCGCCCGGGWLFQGCACGEYISMGEYDGLVACFVGLCAFGDD